MKILFRMGLAIAAMMMTQTLSAAPITVGADWFATTTAPPAFFWSGLDVDNDDGPFTYSHGTATDIFITDDFITGDVFEVYDFGVSIGTTSAPAGGAGSGEIGPAAAFLDPDYSSGTFTVGPGAHSITIRTIAGLSSGRGYIKVEEVPEPSTIAALASLAAIGFCVTRRRRHRLNKNK